MNFSKGGLLKGALVWKGYSALALFLAILHLVELRAKLSRSTLIDMRLIILPHSLVADHQICHPILVQYQAMVAQVQIVYFHYLVPHLYWDLVWVHGSARKQTFSQIMSLPLKSSMKEHQTKMCALQMDIQLWFLTRDFLYLSIRKLRQSWDAFRVSMFNTLCKYAFLTVKYRDSSTGV